MSKRDDLNILFKRASIVEHVKQYLFIINALFATFSLITLPVILRSIMVNLQIIITIGYVVFLVIGDYVFWYSASSTRRKANLDNAFSIDMTEYKTDGYYNNNCPPSITRYALNSFESIFFTKTIVCKSLVTNGVKTFVVVMIFLITCLTRVDYEIILIITQTIFSSVFIIDFIVLLIFKFRVDVLYDSFYRDFITIGLHSEKQVIALLGNAIEYEAIKAHYRVHLSTKTFNRLNSELSEKWALIENKIIL